MPKITYNWVDFNISTDIIKQHKELIDLVLNTESMDNEERQYWFDIMPSMTDDQIDRLFDILDTERKKLLELEKKYQEEIKALNEKQLIEWQEFQAKKNREKIMKEESKTKQDNPDDILAWLDDL